MVQRSAAGVAVCSVLDPGSGAVWLWEFIGAGASAVDGLSMRIRLTRCLIVVDAARPLIGLEHLDVGDTFDGLAGVMRQRRRRTRWLRLMADHVDVVRA